MTQSLMEWISEYWQKLEMSLWTVNIGSSKNESLHWIAFFAAYLWGGEKSLKIPIFLLTFHFYQIFYTTQFVLISNFRTEK